MNILFLKMNAFFFNNFSIYVVENITNIIKIEYVINSQDLVNMFYGR